MALYVKYMEKLKTVASIRENEKGRNVKPIAARRIRNMIGFF